MTKDAAPGAQAPDFDLPLDGGGRVSLASFAGRKLALIFYPRDDTPTCTTELQTFDALRADFAAARVDLLGVSEDSVKSHDRFKAKHGFKIPLASDEEGHVLRAYGVWVEKSMWGKRFMGVERATFLIGPSGEVLKIWRKVRVAGHAADVLAAARQA